MPKKSKSRFRSDLPRGVQPVALSEVLSAARFFACDDILAACVRDNADSCEQGDVFIARITPTGDGHEHVASAVARGVAGIVAERMVPTDGVPLCVVPHAGRAFAQL